MPSNPARLTITGYSSTLNAAAVSNTYPIWFPDTSVRPFNISVGVVASSTATTYSVQHSFDYQGHLSSDFNGFEPRSSVAGGATWFDNTGISGVTGNSNGNYAFPVSAIRLNVSAGIVGSSATVITAVLTQAG